MKLNTAQKFSILYIVAMGIFWIILLTLHKTTGIYNYLFSFLMSLLPLVGGLFAMTHVIKLPEAKGFIDKGIFFTGLGLFLWGCGEIIWSYYNFVLGVPAPYPSFADLGFAPSVFFYCIGAVYLARAAGADFGLQRKYAKLFIVLASLAMFAFSYYILIVVARHGVLVTPGDSFLKSIFDLAYPIGDFISLTAAVVLSGLSFRYIAKEYRIASISILIGLAGMFIADSIFSYTTSIGTYFNGNFGDLVFTIALFLISFGIFGFIPKSDIV
jgi:hypothetical protein